MHDQVKDKVENFSALTFSLNLLLPHHALSANRQAFFHYSIIQSFKKIFSFTFLSLR
jgi:hypothetical protein